MEGSGELLVRDIMVRAPIWIGGDASVAEAASLMRERNIGAIMVCTGERRVEGIFTERDLLHIVAARLPAEQTPLREVMTTQPAVIAPDLSWGAALELMSERRVRHLPVVEAGQLVGMLSVRDLMQHRTASLEWLVQQRTVDLERTNAELVERETRMQFHLDLAGRIQRQILPGAPPQLPPLAVAAAYHPLDRVSGDYYDFEPLPPERVGILIADASGHGVPAAFVSVMAKTTFHVHGRGLESPAHVLQAMNRQLMPLIEGGHFITMFYGVFDRQTRVLTYASAGHPAPLHLHAASGLVDRLDACGLMIGVVAEPEYPERRVELQPGDALLLYTDGVIECRDPRGGLFTTERLETLLAGLAGCPPAAIIQRLSDELARFRQDRPFDDDVTAIALKVQT